MATATIHQPIVQCRKSDHTKDCNMFLNCRRYRLVVISVFAATLLASPAFAEPTYEDFCEQGRQCLTKDDYAGAVRHYSAAIALNPNEELAIVCRALAYHKTHDYDNAFKDCSQAITINPKAVPPYLIQGDIYQATNRMDDAVKAFTKAIDCDPRRSYSYVARGMAYRAIKKNDYAIADFKEGRKHDPKNVNAWLELAYTYRDMGTTARAIEAFDGAIACDDKYAASYFFRARLLFASNQIERTISDCKKAIELDKDEDKFAAAQGLLAAAYYAHQDYADAAKCFAKVADWVPVPVAYYWLGKSHFENKDFQAAVDAFTNAIKNKEDFVPAFFGRACAYEALDQKDKAESDKKTGKQLGTAPGVRHDDTATDSTALVDMLYSKTKGLSPESLRAYLTKNDNKPSAVELAIESARESAEVSRQQAMAAKTLTTDIGPEVIAPTPTRKAQESFQRATDFFQKHRYELASLHFHVMEVQYKEVLAEFEKRAQSDFGLWLAWAKQKAEQLPKNKSTALVYAHFAFGCHQCGDQDGYAQWMKKAVSHIKSRGIADPAAGVSTLLIIADIQADCHDTDSALKSVQEAIVFCDGIQKAGGKSVAYARCAGYSAKLGDLKAWNDSWMQAQKYAKQVGDSTSDARALQPAYASCVAFAEASSLQKAIAAAEELPSDRCSRNYSLEYLAPAYARIALSAAKSNDNHSIYEKCYVDTCAYLASFLDSHWPDANYGRAILARADASAGNCDRALIGAINTPSPDDRASIYALIIHKKVEQKDFDGACDVAGLLPPTDGFSSASYWLAQAESARQWSMLQLRQWAEKRSTPADRIMALVGVAAVIKQTGSLGKPTTNGLADIQNNRPNQAANDAAALLRKSHDDPNASEAFDRIAASSPDWWLQEAQSLVATEKSPRLQAALWIHLGSAYASKGDQAAAKSCFCHAKQSAMTMWREIATTRSDARLNYDGNYKWPSDFRAAKAETAKVIAILDTLMNLEYAQRQASAKEDAIDTLLLVLKSAEALARNPGYAAPLLPTDRAAWMARVVGRLTLCGRQDLADALFAQNPWCVVNSLGCKQYLAGVAAAESHNKDELEKVATFFQPRAGSGSERDSQYAASLYVLRTLIAANEADETSYRKAAMTVGGLVNNSRYPAPKACFIGLAQAAAVMGECDVALEYVERAGGVRLDQFDVLAVIAVEMAKRGQIAEAQKLSKQIQDDAANVPVWAALATAETKASAGKLSVLLQKIDSCPINAMKAASMFGVASALQKEKPNAADSQ